MKKQILTIIAVMMGMLLAAQEMTLPSDFFGFEPGADRKLFDYEQLISYLQELDGQSDRLLMQEIGKSPEGRPMYIAFISSPENLQKLETYRAFNRELALNPDPDSAEYHQMLREAPVFVLATLSMHSTEVAPSQSSPLVAYEYASTTDSLKLEWLENVVYMMVPNHNPDGMDKIVHNYWKYLGTRYEGASYPGVYHKYVGHDNNRDFVILSQDDSRAIARVYNLDWHPQVMVEKHQMGSTGPRYFVPPNHDPVAENVPAGIFNWGGVFGQHMVTDMTEDGLAGVSQHNAFDDYWPGATTTCTWKNVIAFLTEAASVQTATPIYIEPTELVGRGKGLSEYKKSTNMLLPWEGGWWRLGDIVNLELSSTRSIIKTASLYREDILRFRHRMTSEQVALGKNQAPYYYILPGRQHDLGEMVNLVNLMKEHGIDIYRLEQDVILDGRLYAAGDVVIPMAQPFRPFIKEVMEKQFFPERHYTPDGELIKPYDITSWSLPLHRNVSSREINVRSEKLEDMLIPIEGKFDLGIEVQAPVHTIILPVNSNESYRAAFLALEKGLKVQRLMGDLVVRGERYREGSFAIWLDPKKRDAWEEVVESLPFAPGLISDKRAVKGKPVTMPSLALVETYFHDMDAGWTRFLLDTYHVPYQVLHPGEVAEAELSENFDVVLFPDTDKEVLMTGKRKSQGSYYMGTYHPDYVKGLEKEGMNALMDFSSKGGIILSWGQSARLFEGLLKIKGKDTEEEFNLPFRDISPELVKKGLYVPGSLATLDLVGNHPLTLGMPEQIGVFTRGRPVFQTGIPFFDMDRKVIGTYPEKEVIMSGYGDKAELMGNKAAMIWMKKGKGQFVFYGFGPQFRASSQASYKLLFNALLLEKL